MDSRHGKSSPFRGSGERSFLESAYQTVMYITYKKKRLCTWDLASIQVRKAATANLQRHTKQKIVNTQRCDKAESSQGGISLKAMGG